MTSTTVGTTVGTATGTGTPAGTQTGAGVGYRTETASNTAVAYVYRDQHNNKFPAAVVLAGALTDFEYGQIMGTLEDKRYFHPTQVGLAPIVYEIHEDEESGEFSPWHELVSIEDTDEPVGADEDYLGDPDQLPTSAQLRDAFLAVTWDTARAEADVRATLI